MVSERNEKNIALQKERDSYRFNFQTMEIEITIGDLESIKSATSSLDRSYDDDRLETSKTHKFGIINFKENIC